MAKAKKKPVKKQPSKTTATVYDGYVPYKEKKIPKKNTVEDFVWEVLFEVMVPVKGVDANLAIREAEKQLEEALEETPPEGCDVTGDSVALDITYLGAQRHDLKVRKK